MNTDQWLTEHIQVEDGLPSSTVFSLQQDNNGFLWFGTTDGVARFDGYDFKIYRHDGDDINSISNNNAGNLFIDSKNKLWIGTFGGGVNTLDLGTDEITRHPYSNDNSDLKTSPFVQTFLEDSQSNTWIGTPDGLFKFTGEVSKHYKHIENNKNSLIHSRVWSLVESLKGDIFIGTSNGLSKLNPKTDEITNYYLPKHLVVDISSNQFRKLYLIKNKIWIGSSSGLLVFDIKTSQFTSFPLSYNIKVNDLLQVKNTLLVVTTSGLFQFDLLNQSFVFNDNNLWRFLENIDLRQVFMDRSGLLWFASRDTGIYKINPTGGLFRNTKIKQANKKPNELSQKIWTIEFDAEGDTYLGTAKGLYVQKDKHDFSPVLLKNGKPISGRIRTLKWNKNQDLWIGSSDGLFILPNGERIANEVYQPFDILGIKPADIYSIEETHSGELWMSLNNLGILKWHPEKKEAQLLQKYKGVVLTDLNIGKIVEDSEFNVWVTTNLLGLIKFDQDHNMTVYKNEFSDSNSISSDRVRDIYEDPLGEIWVGTARGINIFSHNTNNFRRYRQAGALLDESIYSISGDYKNNIWVSHNFGISHIDTSTNKTQKFKINASIRKDGLSIRAANINSKGKLFFGSNNGLYTFNPNELKACIHYQPTLLLTQVKINNLPLTTGQITKNNNKYELFYNDRALFFQFSALEYNATEQVRYSYKISGVSDEWQDVSDSRSLELKSLKPGQYTLEIRANNSDCRWSEQKLIINIEVHPAWWNLWWVWLIFGSFIILAALTFHYFRSNIIRKRNLELEALVESRTSELLLLNKKLESASQTDFLTGLYNRSGFIEKFNNIPDSVVQGHIVLADIDHFKKINDQFGHMAGDEVLKATSKIMLSLIQKDDFVARWGGEEFIFYISNNTAEEVYLMIEKIRTTIEKSKLIYAEKEIKVTCTFGICQIQSGMELNQSIKAADESMYLGKAKQRNITVVSKEF
ncbi:ligand-binding sensor domain-containing protein [Marinicella rhabdoformis]|uniref:ligand-binding sensor domain-containing protein n=1 Tax=Marinicella rhabdoformis TaxID=2580566 RepID=UPI0015D0961B|nr:ligand-binding sensor domain-containing diguanylate cyclase [Marinicella rhabdoformis]